MVGERLRSDVIAGRHDAATERTSGAQTVDPCDGVAVAAVVRLQGGHQRVEVACPCRLDLEERGTRGDEVERDLGDQSGEPHPPHRGDEQWVIWGEPVDGRIGGHERQPGHVLPDAPIVMMVLPVDISGDRTAERHHASPRGDGDEPAEGNGPPKQRIDAHPGLGADHAVHHVEVDDPRHRGRLDDGSSGGLCSVPIGPAEPAETEGTAGRRSGHRPLCCFRVGRSEHGRCGRGGSTPSGEQRRAFSLRGARSPRPRHAMAPVLERSSRPHRAPSPSRPRSLRSTSSGASASARSTHHA